MAETIFADDPSLVNQLPSNFFLELDEAASDALRVLQKQAKHGNRESCIQILDLYLKFSKIKNAVENKNIV